MPPPRLAAITLPGIGEVLERPTHSPGVPEPHVAGAAALLAAAWATWQPAKAVPPTGSPRDGRPR